MRNYRIRVESDNPEFEVNEKLKEGVQADGFLLLCIRNDKPYMESLYGMSIDNLAEYWRKDTDVCTLLRQAAAIGEGYRTAARIHEEQERSESAITLDGKLIAKMLMEMGASGSAEAETE